jgi:hypothetical protein
MYVRVNLCSICMYARVCKYMWTYAQHVCIHVWFFCLVCTCACMYFMFSMYAHEDFMLSMYAHEDFMFRMHGCMYVCMDLRSVCM